MKYILPLESGNFRLEQTKFPVFWQHFPIPWGFPDRDFFSPYSLFSLCSGYPDYISYIFLSLLNRKHPTFLKKGLLYLTEKSLLVGQLCPFYYLCIALAEGRFYFLLILVCDSDCTNCLTLNIIILISVINNAIKRKEIMQVISIETTYFLRSCWRWRCPCRGLRPTPVWVRGWRMFGDTPRSRSPSGSDTRSGTGACPPSATTWMK